MRTRQLPYKIVGDCSDEDGHQCQALDRLILETETNKDKSGVETETNKDKDSICNFPTLFLISCFEIELVLCNLHLTRFDLTKDVLFDTFFIAVLNK